MCAAAERMSPTKTSSSWVTAAWKMQWKRSYALGSEELMARFGATGISPRLSAPPLFHLWRAQGETCRSRYHTRACARLLETTGNLFPLHHRDFIESTKIAFLLTEMTTDNF
jgi:hypothetical protein